MALSETEYPSTTAPNPAPYRIDPASQVVYRWVKSYKSYRFLGDYRSLGIKPTHSQSEKIRRIQETEKQWIMEEIANGS